MIRRTHPGHDDLRRWLETEKPERVGDHVSGCGECMAYLETVTDLESDLVSSLNQAWSAPMGIEQRTATGVEHRIRREETMLGFLDLFAIGGDVFRTLIDEEPFDG